MANYLVQKAGRPFPLSLTSKQDDLAYIDPMYKMRLYSRGNSAGSIDIEGYVPESFQLNIASDWGAVHDGSMIDVAANLIPGASQALQVASKGAEAGGLSTRIWQGSAQQWSGGSYLDFSLPFKVRAWIDTEGEVMGPLRNILKLVTPTLVAGGAMLAPGPTPVSQISKDLLQAVGADTLSEAATSVLGGEVIRLEIGTWFRMYPCVIQSVNVEIDSLFEHGTGNPMSVNFEINVKSYYTVTRQQLDEWIGGIPR